MVVTFRYIYLHFACQRPDIRYIDLAIQETRDESSRARTPRWATPGTAKLGHYAATHGHSLIYALKLAVDLLVKGGRL